MIKNRTTQIIFQTIYCTIGIIGCVASLGIFDNIQMIRWDFYVHFTHISNFFCLGIMMAALIQTIKKKEDSSVSTTPMLKFIGMISILLTFCIFNFFLAGAEGRDPQFNWRIGSICLHVILPIMYIADWFLFYERKKTKWYYPIASISFPFAYAIFICLQAIILQFNTSILIPGTTTPLIYPYFFLNIETQGIGGVIKWLFILFAAIVVLGYIFFGIDKIGKKTNIKNLEDNDIYNKNN